MKEFLEQKRYNRLAKKMQRGDRQAAEKIFNHFYPRIFGFFLTQTCNRDLAEDLTQEVFLKVLRKIDSFDYRIGTFASWIWKIARNNLIDYYREKKAVYLEDCLANNRDFATDGKNSPEELSRKLEVENVLRVLKQFKPEEQEIFSLHYVADLSYKTISEMTGKTEGALRTMIHRLNLKIKRKLK
jgi:RNA polymerase sigma-70 factor (ECF subfamily)